MVVCRVTLRTHHQTLTSIIEIDTFQLHQHNQSQQQRRQNRGKWVHYCLSLMKNQEWKQRLLLKVTSIDLRENPKRICRRGFSPCFLDFIGSVMVFPLKLLSWNVRGGLGKGRKQRFLRYLNWKIGFSFLGIIETKRQVMDDFINESSQMDLPLHGRKFTQRSAVFSSHLDHTSVNSCGNSSYPFMSLQTLSRRMLDHNPILSATEQKVDQGAKPFKSLDCLWDHPNFKSFLENTWKGIAGRSILEKLRVLRSCFKVWKKDIF